MKVLVLGPRDNWNFDYIVDKMKQFVPDGKWGLVYPGHEGTATVARDYAEMNAIEVVECDGFVDCSEKADYAIVFYDQLAADGKQALLNSYKKLEEKGIDSRLIEI